MTLPNVEQDRSVTDTSVLGLGDDLLLQICTHLSIDELFALRKTCRYLFTISRSRYLWHNVLRRDVVDARRPVPSYLKPTSELGTAELEALAHRALRLDSPCQQPTIVRLDSKRSVTWVRLVHGQWLLVASTSSKDNHTLGLYSLIHTEEGKPTQLAVTQLPGPVSSGEAQVQRDQLIVALCFQSPRRMTAVYAVHRRNEALEFAKLRTLDGLSHVRCLRDNVLGCGFFGETHSPCVANWTTGEVHLLPQSPGTPIVTMALRDDICVVIYSSGLIIYSLSLTNRLDAELVQAINFDHTMGSVSASAEREALPFFHEPAEDPRTRMLFFTASSLSITVLRLRQHATSDSAPASPPTAPFALEVVAESELKRGDVLSARPSLPRFGGSASRISWVYTPTLYLFPSSSLVTGRLVPVPSSSAPANAKFEITSECTSARLPALHALPVMDYDDGSGVVVVGNACGELALCNYAGPVSAALARCFRDIPVPAAAVSTNA